MNHLSRKEHVLIESSFEKYLDKVRELDSKKQFKLLREYDTEFYELAVRSKLEFDFFKPKTDDEKLMVVNIAKMLDFIRIKNIRQ